MKCSSITLDDGRKIEVVKDPITDQGKKSKSGRVAPFKIGNEYGYKPFDGDNITGGNLFKKVFENGELKEKQSFEEIRDLSNKDDGDGEISFDVNELKLSGVENIYVKVIDFNTNTGQGPPSAGGNRSKKRRYRKSKKARKTRKSHRKSKKGRGRR
jgi:hypothetical protein